MVVVASTRSLVVTWATHTPQLNCMRVAHNTWNMTRPRTHASNNTHDAHPTHPPLQFTFDVNGSVQEIGRRQHTWKWTWCKRKFEQACFTALHQGNNATWHHRPNSINKINKYYWWICWWCDDSVIWHWSIATTRRVVICVVTYGYNCRSCAYMIAYCNSGTHACV